MTCDVEYLRLTDGHGWTHKPAVGDRDYYYESRIAKPVTKVPPEKLLCQIAYECYIEHKSYIKVCQILNLPERTARNRVCQYAIKHGLVIPRLAEHRSRQNDERYDLSKLIYTEYMAGATAIFLGLKYKKSDKTIKGILRRYRDRHNMPGKRVKKAVE